jgi:hypothetical protein
MALEKIDLLELKIPSKFRVMIELAAAATLKYSYREIPGLLFNIKLRLRIWDRLIIH